MRAQVAERRLEAAKEDARRDIEIANLQAQENELQAQVGADPLFPTEGTQYDDKAARETSAMRTACCPSHFTVDARRFDFRWRCRWVYVVLADSFFFLIFSTPSRATPKAV